MQLTPEELQQLSRIHAETKLLQDETQKLFALTCEVLGKLTTIINAHYVAASDVMNKAGAASGRQFAPAQTVVKADLDF